MREQLIQVLTEAAEIEHNLLCSYLYAAFSMKHGVDEGLTPPEAAAVSRWRKSVMSVALEEMAHLALVNNLLVCVGGSHRSMPTRWSISSTWSVPPPGNVGPRVDPGLIAERLLELSQIHSGVFGDAADNPIPAAVQQLQRSTRG